MILKVNIDYMCEPEAIIEFMQKRKDIYPYLTNNQQQKINEEYNLSVELNVTSQTLRKAMPEEWKEFLELKKYSKKVIKPHQYGFKKINEYRRIIRVKESKKVITSQMQNTPEYAPTA